MNTIEQTTPNPLPAEWAALRAAGYYLGEEERARVARAFDAIAALTIATSPEFADASRYAGNEHNEYSGHGWVDPAARLLEVWDAFGVTNRHPELPHIETAH